MIGSANCRGTLGLPSWDSPSLLVLHLRVPELEKVPWHLRWPQGQASCGFLVCLELGAQRRSEKTTKPLGPSWEAMPDMVRMQLVGQGWWREVVATTWQNSKLWGQKHLGSNPALLFTR